MANLAKEWSEIQEIEFKYIQPGKPTQNVLIERFNKTFREGILDTYLFETLEEVIHETEEWVMDYNNERPHDALGGMSLVKFKQKQKFLGLRSASATPSLHSAQETLINNLN